jgi:CubicO group peptidase (beta-lactamase class C family)
MGIFLQTFLNHGSYRDFQLLSRPSVAAMTRNQVQGIPREMIDGITNQPQGFGWFLLDGIQFPNTPCLISPSSYGHSGASGTMIWVDPTYDLIGAFLFTKIREENRPLDHFIDSIMGCIID